MFVMKKMKQAMVLSEVLLALIICGVILVISIHMFKSVDVTRTPYIYSTMQNLSEANSVIMLECANKGTCTEGFLPEDLSTYCLLLSEKYNTVGEILCRNSDQDVITQNDENTEKFRRTNGNTDYDYNIKLPSGIGIYGILENGNWKTIEYQNAVSNKEAANKYIDIVLDTNAQGKPNHFLDDVYPIRIFSNGDIVPGVLDSTGGGISHKGFDSSEVFGYRVIKKRTENNSTTITVADIRTSTEKTADAPFRTEALSFREANCRAYGSAKATTILKKYYNDVDGVENLANWCSGFETGGVSQAADCTQENVICEVEQTRPKASGFIKFMGI